jgi:hypothetical protein
MARINYRKAAFDQYAPICAYCGFGIPEILEVAHLDGRRGNNDTDNLVLVCPTCHKMHDLGLIPTATLKDLRDSEATVDWSKRMKDAGKKAAATRKRRVQKRKDAGQKAAETRKRRLAGQKAARTRKRRAAARRAADTRKRNRSS